MHKAPNLKDYEITQKHKNALEFIKDVTSNPDQVQQQVLTKILTQNANVEYLNRHGLSGHSDRETFKKLIPVISYDDIQPDITRIANGDKSPILSSHPISEFFTGSGTSRGEVKLIPTIEDEHARRAFLRSLTMPIISQFVPGLDKGKGMYFSFVRSEAKAPGGLVAQPVLTSFYKSSHFKQRLYNQHANFTSPIETILCPDSYQSMYSQMLCGLCLSKQVLWVGAVFASGLIWAIRFLQNNCTDLYHDIRTGILNPVITDPSIRKAVMKVLNPDSELADFIRFECSKNSWRGIITRLWPNTKYIDAIATGTMSHYIPTLDYYGNALPIVCNIYSSSECNFGINLNPLCKPSEVSYTLIPTMAYFEFLPVVRKTSSFSMPTSLNQKELLDLSDVKLGQEYELVVTTYAGLFRYRVGDVLRVAGFKNKSPQFNFICRMNVELSVDADKTDEVELRKAVETAVNHVMSFGVTLTEYTSYADITTIPGHYVIFWELSVNDVTLIPPSVYEECCFKIEESLNSVYRQQRALDKSIGPLEIKIVENRTFDKLLDYAVSLGASINQYKTPRCVKFAPIVELLNSRVVSSYFSQKCPSWDPGHI